MFENLYQILNKIKYGLIKPSTCIKRKILLKLCVNLIQIWPHTLGMHFYFNELKTLWSAKVPVF